MRPIAIIIDNVVFPSFVNSPQRNSGRLHSVEHYAWRC